MKISVYNVVLCTFNETMFDAKRDKLSELINFGVSISHATIDKDRTKEIEVEGMRKE
jgi:hypothetical protein